jgi:hypothetical protein
MTPSSIVPQANDERTHSTMMAWRVHEFGPPEVMKFERVPWPKPGPGEVLVKVEAAGVGPWDGCPIPPSFPILCSRMRPQTSCASIPVICSLITRCVSTCSRLSRSSEETAVRS